MSDGDANGVATPTDSHPWWATPAGASPALPTAAAVGGPVAEPAADSPATTRATSQATSPETSPVWAAGSGAPDWSRDHAPYQPGGSAHYPGAPVAEQPVAVRERPRRNRLAPLAAAAAGLIVLTSAITGLIVHHVDRTTARASTVITTRAPAPVTGATSDLHAALNTIMPSVVIINTQIGGTADAFGNGETGTAAGTGIVESADGVIVTNAHVVAEATSIKVTIPGHGAVSAHVLGANTAKDLAAIKVDGITNLTPAVFAATSTVQVGNQVLAVGNAEGYGGTPSVSAGIVSALGRTLPGSNDTPLTHLIQTDAAINPGNSGGPLVDTAGHVIGIDTAVAAGSRTEPAVNIGFAIPSDDITAELPNLLDGSTASAGTAVGYLGVNPQDGGDGALITAVGSGTPAAAAGIQVGDTVTKVDGKAIGSASALVSVIGGDKPGQKIMVTVQRATGATADVTVTLGSRP